MKNDEPTYLDNQIETHSLNTRQTHINQMLLLANSAKEFALSNFKHSFEFISVPLWQKKKKAYNGRVAA